jgi:energy-coupling factor transport system ATP-binding protein
VLYLEQGKLLFDGPVAAAREWLAAHRPRYAGRESFAAPDAPPGELLVEIEAARFAYGDGPAVLDAASLSVRRGEIVTLEGPNGSGKSTLAKLAAGLLEPGAGTVRRSGRATYLSQDPGRYLVRETAIQEVALAVNGDRRRAQAALERFDLGFAASRHPRDLSSGERERLGLAAVAVSDPDLLVLDEPTRGVDPDRRADLAAWMLAEAASGRGLLVATHDAGLPADRRVRVGAAREEPVAV